MTRPTVITLINKTIAATKDSIGQLVETETTRDVFCELRSINRSEWSAAGQMGLKPELVATMFAYDYEGEESASITFYDFPVEGEEQTSTTVKYGIYRTYLDGEKIELYLERKAGVTNG